MIGTKFNIIDLSKIPEQTTIETPDAAPVILTAFPSAKGTEKLIQISGTDYRKMFGDPDYKKYGQVSVQNQRMIDSGAKLLCKRVVASDAKLANTTLVAKISAKYTEEEVKATNEAGDSETTHVVGEEGQEQVTPVKEVVKAAEIEYVAVSTDAAHTLDDVTSKFGKQGKIIDGQAISDINSTNYMAYGFNALAEDEVLFIPTADNTSAVVLPKEDEPATIISSLITSFVSESGDAIGAWVVKKDAVNGTGTKEDPYTLKAEVTADQIVDASAIYPIMTVAEIGRGSSAKSFSITPENAISKNLNFMYYTLNIIEDNTTIETIRFALAPDTIYNGKCIDLNMVASTDLAFSQIHCYEDAVTDFAKAVSQIAGELDEDQLLQNDFLYGTKRKGEAYPKISISEASDLQDSTSQIKVNSDGTYDGSFGQTPALTQTDAVTDKLIAFFTDTKPAVSSDQYAELDATDDIYDLDTYQIDAVFDANYDIRVKDAIVALAEYRGDFMYFRDHGDHAIPNGTAPDDYLSVESRINGSYYGKTNGGVMDDSYKLPKSTYACDWVQSYSVINPYDLKEVDVTINYDISQMMISHILNQVNVPFAGKRNNAIITSIIKDTLNYKPRVTPSANEKEELEDLKCNFASYYKDDFVIETLWTSQEDYTQLSFVNNVMAVQRVIKALRVHFPSIRYQFITSSEDLQAYTTNINEFLSSYTNMFAELRFEYIQDSVAAANKIYRAALYFRFNDFAQGEQIDAYMLPTEVITG